MSIQIKNLVKKFDSNYALKNVNLEIKTGMFGLIGRNGTGKTTFMRILTTLIEPTSGSINLFGLELNTSNKQKIRSMIGYLPQEFGFYDSFTVVEIMEYMAILDNIDKPTRQNRIKKNLEDVNLYAHKDKKYKNLSGGMKRRLGLAQAMLSNPKVLIVDEPTAGVDPDERIKIRNLLRRYSEDNIVLFSTHIVEDIENTCNYLAVLSHGNIVFNGTVAELNKTANGSIWQCELENNDELNKLESDYKILSTAYDENKIIAKILAHKPPTENSIQIKPTIEDAYIYSITKGEA